MAKLSEDYKKVVFPSLIIVVIFFLIFIIGFMFNKPGLVLASFGVAMLLWAGLSIKLGKVPTAKVFGSWFFYADLSNPIGIIILIFIVLVGIFFILEGILFH